jgi:hypothetical protein
MKKISAAYFYYCLVISLFIFISGLLTVKNINELPFQLIFLPVPAYFIYSLIKFINLKKNAPKGINPVIGINLKEKGNLIILSLFLLGALVMFGIKKIIG